MDATYRALATLLLGTGILVLGQGLLLGIVPLSMDGHGFSAGSTALVGATYFCGFLFGAWRGEYLIRAVGHIRSYGGLIALVIVSVLALPLVSGVMAWSALRFIHGFAAGGAFLAIEAWLNAAAPSHVRGHILAMYMVITLGALGGAQFLASINDPLSLVPFLLGGIVYALSIIPPILTRVEAPTIHGAERMPFSRVYRHSPFAFVASLVSGMAVGAFWTLTPFAARRFGLTVDHTSTLMAVTVFAGLVLQWPTGYFSSRYDRRQIVIVIAVLGSAAALTALTVVSTDQPEALYACFAVLGGVFCLYPLLMAHAIDHTTEPSAGLSISQGLLMANGFGQTLGPLGAGLFMGFSGPQGLLIFFAVILAGIAVYTLWRLRVGVPAEPQAQGKHVFMRATTPAGAALDPRVSADKE